MGPDCSLHRCLIGGEAALAVSPRGSATAIWIVQPHPQQGFDSSVESHTGGSAPIVVGDVVIVGGQASRGAALPGIGDVRGYDVRTGKPIWTFHTIPRPGEYGNDTWLNNSWEVSGAPAVWGFLSADDDLGYVYLPVESPTAIDLISPDSSALRHTRRRAGRPAERESERSSQGCQRAVVFVVVGPQRRGQCSTQACRQ